MGANREQELESWLARFLGNVQAVAGTVHLHENGGLRLGAAVNIPLPVRQAVEWVPSGKGMAGMALERGEPVQTCNLKEDASGAVKPGARAVNAVLAIPKIVTGGLVLLAIGMDASRNYDHYVDGDSPKIDEALGNTEWRERWKAVGVRRRDFRQFLAAEFSMRYSQLRGATKRKRFCPERFVTLDRTPASRCV